MKKKKTQAEIIKEALELNEKNERTIAALKKRFGLIINNGFEPLPGAHTNNCNVCKFNTVCSLSSHNFTFCPKQKTTKNFTPMDGVNENALGKLFTLRIN